MLAIRLANDNDRSKWDSFVSRNPDTGPYHWFGWKNAVEETYGHKGYYLIAEKEGGEIAGILPVICIKFPWGKKKLISLPYCDYAGPLGDPLTKKALVEESQNLKERIGAQELEIRFEERECWLDSNFVENNKSSYYKVRMLLGLPETTAELWSEFKPKLRAQIRRPQKEGFYAEIGGKEFLPGFYQVFQINMHRLGSPVHDRRWFESLFDEYGEKAKVGIVRHKNGIPVAGGILLTIGQKACVPWASSLREYNSVAPNMLLYYQFLTWAIENESTQFDFGRSTPMEGTYKFKEQWGSFPVPLFWYMYPLNGNSSFRLSLNFHARDKIATLWSKLPMGLANYLGPKIRKYIAL